MIFNEEPSILRIGDAEIPVTSSECSEVEIRRQDVQSCKELSFTLPQRVISEIEFPEVSVTWPTRKAPHATAKVSEEPCIDSKIGLLTLVPPPSIRIVDPPAICHLRQNITLTGRHMITLNGVQPSVIIDGVNFVPDEDVKLFNCSSFDVDGLDAQHCTQLQITINGSDFSDSILHTLQIRNPPPGDCISSEAVFEVHPPPEIYVVDPSEICNQGQDRTLILTGSNFTLVNGTELPVVYLNGIAVQSTNITGCYSLSTVDYIQLCNTLEVFVPEGTVTTGGYVEINLINPYPLPCDTIETSLLATPPLISITNSTPGSLCISRVGDRSVVFYGDGFLQNAQVFLNGADWTNEVEIRDCNPVDYFSSVICREIVLTIPDSGFPVGPVSIDIFNPAPFDCSYSTSSALFISDAPSFIDITPPLLCSR